MRWPNGLRSSGVACGIKTSGERDLGVIVADDSVAWAGTFTKNGAAAASVGWCRSLLGRPVRAVVANSGNANACTGARGIEAVQTVAGSVAAALGCETEEILVASTGPIGIQLPTDRVVSSIPEAMVSLSGDPDDFARSILTTDTATKSAAIRVGDASMIGIAKGAAMLAPNMATMLAFVATDAGLEGDALQRVLAGAVSRSFDSVCVDACESTNDSVFLLSTGLAGPVDEDLFAKGLQEVCWDLALQIVHDAEGSTRVMRIRVLGATDDSSAHALGRAVAASALWRAAVHGADPNWGRVLAALGSSDRDLDLDRVELCIGREVVFAAGEPTGSMDAAARAMTADDLVVVCTVGDGPGVAELLTTDLSPDYVRLNAFGST